MRNIYTINMSNRNYNIKSTEFFSLTDKSYQIALLKTLIKIEHDALYVDELEHVMFFVRDYRVMEENDYDFFTLDITIDTKVDCYTLSFKYYYDRSFQKDQITIDLISKSGYVYEKHFFLSSVDDALNVFLDGINDYLNGVVEKNKQNS
ncbi:hypothetical protein [Aquitalea pelogenes]|uniref:hypothetical protein n=1 Tax=Aquitalea pelogenes TaxID=1293573 RepID=UPI0035B0098B